ncbi:hypothetical protein SAMN06296952_1562 [Oscillospiraceae bacterium]|nr:hypothetical protein SAMN06296952_1562 [Oscillospiraceae bacterium]
MKTFKKDISLLLIASIMLTTCSCAFGNIEEDVLDMADDLGKNIVDRNYKKITKIAGEEDDKLEAVLSLSTDDSVSYNEAREIIASTLSYEVDEDSYEGDRKEGSVDIVFTYVDYEKVVDDNPVFADLGAFEEAVEDCDDTIEVTITFEFEKDKDGIYCTNIGDIEDIFPYSKEEFNFALDLYEYVDGITFIDCGPGFVYTDVDYISCTLGVTGDGQLLTWDYYYVVERDGVQIYQSSIITAECPTQLEAEYSATGSDILEDGTYDFIFYTADNEMLYSAFADVTHTEVTPSPTPTPVPSASGEDVLPGPEYVYPEDGIIALPDTDLVFDLPDGYYCLAPDTSDFQEIMGGDQWMADQAIFSAQNNLGTDLLVIRLNHQGYSSQSESFATMADNLVTGYSEYGTVTSTETSVTVGDRVFPAYIIGISRGSGTVYISICLVGDDDDTFLLTVMGLNSEELYDIMAGVSIV